MSLRRTCSTFLILAALAMTAGAAEHPRDHEIHDNDTLAWWRLTETLSNDGMEGRDTGSPAYQRAADYVATRFKAAGLKPAGDGGSYLQPVAMHEIEVDAAHSHFVLLRSQGATPLEFLQQITIAPAANLPAELEAPLTFRGYCGKEAMSGIRDKFVVCFGTQRDGLPSGAQRAQNARAGGAVGIINIDDIYFTIEPPRWPYAYARTVTLRPGLPAGMAPPHATETPLAALRANTDAFTALLAGTGQDAAAVLKAGGSKQPLANFDLPGTLRMQVTLHERDISSPNVLGVLPGADPKLAGEYVVAAAHLDGYGYGTPVSGDKLYNGTLDDAAYVALLIQMADNIKAHRLPAPKRSILFAAFTGEEKGLLGSYWYVDHPTVPLAQTAADVNLDQLRPLFPLNILTAEALSDSTLGDTARHVGGRMHIEIRADAEPERSLLRRADQYPFLLKHVPAISFIFGYDADTDAERRYREWYQVRYHRPQDDLTQPVDFTAAAKFDKFFYDLIEDIANDPRRPAFAAGSSFKGS